MSTQLTYKHVLQNSIHREKNVIGYMHAGVRVHMKYVFPWIFILIITELCSVNVWRDGCPECEIFSLIRKLYVAVIPSNGQKHAPIHEEQSCGFPGRALTDALVFEESALFRDRFPTASQQKAVLCLQMQPSPSQIGNFASVIPFLPPVLKPGALAFLWRYNMLRKSIHSYF